MKNNVAVVFHSLDSTTHCDDGFGSYWAAKSYFGDDADYLPAVYSQPCPITRPYDAIYFVDFCYGREQMLEIAETLGETIVVLDHHKTAIENMANIEDDTDNILTYFDLERSGAVITWDYFFPDKEAPLGLKMIQDQDLWRFNLPNTKDYIRGLRSYPQDFDVWTPLLTDVNRIMEVIEEGNTLNRAFQKSVKSHVDKATFGNISGWLVPMSNCSLEYSSDVASELCKKHNAKFALAYHIVGNQVKMSLRSDRDGENFDVSAIAAIWGGGGHRNAAGASCTLQNLETFIELKRLI